MVGVCFGDTIQLMAKCIGMSVRQYAVHVGVTPQAIDKARKAGRLVLHPEDGSIDAEASDRRRAQETDPARLHGRKHAAARAIPAAAARPVTEMLHEQSAAPQATDGLTYMQARVANEVMKAQLRRVELQCKKGEVVDRARAMALVFRLARQERDAWIGWPARVAATIAEEVGIGAHSMQTILERHVREHLDQLAEVRPDFR